MSNEALSPLKGWQLNFPRRTNSIGTKHVHARCHLKHRNVRIISEKEKRYNGSRLLVHYKNIFVSSIHTWGLQEHCVERSKWCEILGRQKFAIWTVHWLHLRTYLFREFHPHCARIRILTTSVNDCTQLFPRNVICWWFFVSSARIVVTVSNDFLWFQFSTGWVWKKRKIKWGKWFQEIDDVSVEIWF